MPSAKGRGHGDGRFANNAVPSAGERTDKPRGRKAIRYVPRHEKGLGTTASAMEWRSAMPLSAAAKSGAWPESPGVHAPGLDEASGRVTAAPWATVRLRRVTDGQALEHRGNCVAAQPRGVTRMGQWRVASF